MKVPSFTPSQSLIPFARVNHNKYMVTENTGFIGTSNWSADYFINTGGIGFVFKPEVDGGGCGDNSTVGGGGGGSKENLRDQLANVFQRDWESSYASSSV